MVTCVPTLRKGKTFSQFHNEHSTQDVSLTFLPSLAVKCLSIGILTVKDMKISLLYGKIYMVFRKELLIIHLFGERFSVIWQQFMKFVGFVILQAD